MEQSYHDHRNQIASIAPVFVRHVYLYALPADAFSLGRDGLDDYGVPGLVAGGRMSFWSNQRTIGTCGRCGGPIVEQEHTESNAFKEAQPAKCADCGARIKSVEFRPTYGPVRIMEGGK